MSSMESTEQANLGDLIQDAIEAKEEQKRQQALNGNGALYGRTSITSTDFKPETPKGVCLNCGQKLLIGVARVIGNNNNNVKGCSNCREKHSGEPYQADSLAVKGLRAGNGRWKEDSG